MPKIASPLTVLEVKAIVRPGLHPVGGAPGLHLQVSASGARSWVARLTVGKRVNAAGIAVQHRRDFGLGGFSDVKLADARERATELRRKIAQNIDPLAEKAAAKALAASNIAASINVNEAVLKFIDAKKAKWAGDPKGVSKRQAMLRTHIAPKIGSLRVQDVVPNHIVQVLKPAYEASPSAAERVASLLRNTFDWVRAHGYRDDNPAATEIIDKLMHVANREGRYPSLPYAALPAFMRELRARDGMSALALEATILSALRTSESLGARWGEIDFIAKVWTIPAARMKIKNEDHRVPLEGALLRLLEKMQKDNTSEFIFVGADEKKPLSDGAMLELLKDMNPLDKDGRRVVTHGFRSTFSTWCSEKTNHLPEVREQALAHKIKNQVEAAYRRGDLLEKRRALMADWASFCEGV